MDHYLTGYAQYLQNISKSPHTIKQYVLDAKHFLKFWQEYQQEDSFSQVLSNYRHSLQQNYAIASVNRKLAGTRKFVLFLYDRSYIKGFDDQLFEPLEQQAKALNYLTNDQVEKIYTALHSMKSCATDEEQQFLAIRHQAMFDLFITTGVKPFEAVRMQWQHVQQHELMILQHQTFRIVEASETFLQQLQQLKEVNDRIFGSNPFVWLGLGNKRGEPITEKTIERFFVMLSKTVGFKVTATICRYTYMKHSDETILFEQLGYTRKDNMKERIKKLKNTNKN